MHIQMAIGLAGQTVQIANEIQSIQMAIQEGNLLQSVPDIAGAIAADAGALRGIIQQSQGLGYGFAANDATFRNTYQPYAASPLGLTQGMPYLTAYTGWAMTTQNATLAALQAAGIQQDQVWNEPQMQNTLQNMMTNTGGRDQLLGAMGVVSEEMISQLEKLRLLMTADMQSKNAYLGYQLTRDQTTAAATAIAVDQVDRVPDHAQFGNVPGLP
jgi:P-type conjugative transfer protein TrbJ